MSLAQRLPHVQCVSDFSDFPLRLLFQSAVLCSPYGGDAGAFGSRSKQGPLSRIASDIIVRCQEIGAPSFRIGMVCGADFLILQTSGQDL